MGSNFSTFKRGKLENVKPQCFAQAETRRRVIVCRE